MFDLQKHQAFHTVGDLRSLLARLPENTVVTICGDISCFYHEEYDKSVICLDCENLTEYYEDAENTPKNIQRVSELDDPDYPYLLFVQEVGWKYATEEERHAAYSRELLVRHQKLVNEKEFIAEAGEKYADSAAKLYPKLHRMARNGMLSPKQLFNYARHLWCMENPNALVYVRTGKNSWAVNTCEREITSDQAMEIICREWGFDKSKVQIQSPAFYESTDWNYICFQCGPLSWVMQDGTLHQQYS